MRRTFFIWGTMLLAAIFTDEEAAAQQYKLHQATTIMGMKTESTIYVKGSRKRTEGGTVMGIVNVPTTIEQCDLKRTIKINDKKKLYFIEPFAKDDDEEIDEDVKPATTVKTKPVEQTTPKKGGTIFMWYSINDTGERKKIYGFTARHVWTNQKIKPSADACTMKDSMIIKTDGWYIDLPQFNCPVSYKPSKTMAPVKQTIDCKDRYVNRRSGKGKLGFPLTETRTIITGAGAQTSNFETTLETLELTTAKLDSMLFEIPLGYKEAATEDELQDKFDVSEIIKQAGAKYDKEVANVDPTIKKTGILRIGVYEPKSEGQLQGSDLQKHMAKTLTVGNIEGVVVATEEEAKKMNCDYSLTTEFMKLKQANKIGGLLKAIKNTDPSAASSFNIEASLTLISLTGAANPPPQKVDGKYEGKVDDAAEKATDEGCRLVIKAVTK